MTTPADVLKTVIEAVTFATYRENSAPSTKIIGKDDMTSTPADRMISLNNKNEDPVFTTNGVRINVGSSFVELIMIDQDPTERDNLQSDLENVFQKSSYSITFKVDKYADSLSPYSKTLNVKILL